MSWLRTALSKASEVASGVGQNANAKANVMSPSTTGQFLAGRMKQYAGVMVQRAGDVMAGGAKLVMERTVAGKNLNSVRHAVRRLDEVSRTARGKERTEALTRWVGALREISKGAGPGSAAARAPTSHHGEENINDEAHPDAAGTEPANLIDNQQAKGVTALQPTASHVLFYDGEGGEEPHSFRDVFLRSSALENIVVSFVKEAPSAQDVELATELLDLCMVGSPEMHASFLQSVMELTPVFAAYAEVKMSQEELLQMVAKAVAGMKISSEIERIESQSAKLGGELDALDLSANPTAPEAFAVSLKLADAARRHEAILSQQGDSASERTAKVNNAKALSGELLGKLSDFESRIKECQQQLQDSVKYRSAKADEVAGAERIIDDELQVLNKRRLHLEEELQQVMGAIASATRRQKELQEEKEQFELVSSSISSRLSTEEAGLNLMMQQHKNDAKALQDWGTFLEDTWKLEAASREGGEKEAKVATEAAQKRLWRVAGTHLVGLQDEVSRCLLHLKTERAKLEEAGLVSPFDSSTGGAASAEQEERKPEGGRRGLPPDEGYRLAEFRLKNALREADKAKAELARRTAALAPPGPGEMVYYDAVKSAMSKVDEMRKEYNELPRFVVKPETPVAEPNPVKQVEDK